MTELANWFDPARLRAFVLGAVPHVIAALIVLVAFWGLFRSTQPLLRAALHRAHFADALTNMLVGGLYKGSLIVIALITAASQLGMNVGAALAGLGVAGIALGFAAQETVANMISGFLVFWDRPFTIGDYITTQDRYGRVLEITMRTTRIRTMENAYIVIPNKQIIGDLLVNHSMYGSVRTNLDIGIAYKESVPDARRVLLAAASGVAGVLAEPAPEVVLSSLGDSSVNLQLRVWIADASQERVTRFAVLEAAKLALDTAGIEIPYPHLQLFVEDVREPAVHAIASVLPREWKSDG